MDDRTARAGAARNRRAWSASALLATLLVVAGCSGTDQKAASAPTTASVAPVSASTPSSAQPSATAATTAATTSAPLPPTTAAPGQVLASRTFTVKGTMSATNQVRLRFDVVELKRRGDLLDLVANLTNLEQDRSQDLRWQPGNRFAGAYRPDITGGDVFSGAVLTDVAAKKRYLVAADSGNACVCTVQLNQVFLGAGQSIELDATYAAPPASTTKLDVAITSLGTFRDLPVS